MKVQAEQQGMQMDGELKAQEHRQRMEEMQIKRGQRLPRRWRGRSRWGCLLMRKRYIQINGELREVCRDYVADPVAPTVWGDLPGTNLRRRGCG